MSKMSFRQNSSTAVTDFKAAQNKGYAILSSESIPSEEAILDAMQSIEAVARRLVDPSVPETLSSEEDEPTAASALLTLDEEPVQSKGPPAPSVSVQANRRAGKMMSELAYKIVKHPYVFITPALLASYTTTRSLLERPHSFPEVFTLYATKPVPKQGAPLKELKPQNPNKASSAIPLKVANAALSSAIQIKNLPVALGIIETTFCAPAYHRSKFLRKGVPPLTGFALAPLAAYTVASQLSVYQNTMDPAMATNVAFAGILAYVGFTATIGIVAVTTANDQMDRVTWATGIPLRERWLREEERAAIDQVAGAWGFKEEWRRGEEDGEEWDYLREWVGGKGMVLDATSLMEGME
ncbi:MAG: hypothetical protein M1827_006583 [Pycnora praestabilis]|nr:MAG: hypothetical protein M1827_006583 [Pycnora praestabilis]